MPTPSDVPAAPSFRYTPFKVPTFEIANPLTLTLVLALYCAQFRGVAVGSFGPSGSRSTTYADAIDGSTMLAYVNPTRGFGGKTLLPDLYTARTLFGLYVLMTKLLVSLVFVS